MNVRKGVLEVRDKVKLFSLQTFEMGAEGYQNIRESKQKLARSRRIVLLSIEICQKGRTVTNEKQRNQHEKVVMGAEFECDTRNWQFEESYTIAVN